MKFIPVHAWQIPPEIPCSVSWAHVNSIDKHRITLRTEHTHMPQNKKWKEISLKALMQGRKEDKGKNNSQSISAASMPVT